MTTKPVVKMTDFFFVAYIGVFDLWLKYMLWLCLFVSLSWENKIGQKDEKVQ